MDELTSSQESKTRRPDAVEVVTLLAGLGADLTVYRTPLPWYQYQGMFHGARRCSREHDERLRALLRDLWDKGSATRVEEPQGRGWEGPPTWVSVLDLEREQVCPSCSTLAFEALGEGHRPGVSLFFAHRAVNAPVPEEPMEVLEELERLEHLELSVQTALGYEELAAHHSALEEALDQRSAELRRRMHSAATAARLLELVGEHVEGAPGDDEVSTVLVRGRVFPYLADLYAAVVEHHRIAALHPEAGRREIQDGSEPVYLVRAPRLVLRYLTSTALSYREVLARDVPTEGLDSEVLQTALGVWDPDGAGALSDLAEAVEAARRVHT